VAFEKSSQSQMALASAIASSGVWSVITFSAILASPKNKARWQLPESHK
jgi:hypothetical protein